MEELILYVIVFVFVYLLYLFFVILKKKKKTSYCDSTEVRYLKQKYQIDINKINMKKLINIVALSNSFIIANTVVIIGFIENIFLKMLVGFVVLFPMIIIIYHLIGIYYQIQSRKK